MDRKQMAKTDLDNAIRKMMEKVQRDVERIVKIDGDNTSRASLIVRSTTDYWNWTIQHIKPRVTLCQADPRNPTWDPNNLPAA